MLTSLQNPTIKQIRKLKSAKARKQQERFLLEGTHLVREACYHHYPLDIVCYTESWHNSHPELMRELPHRGNRLELVSDDVLKSIATTVHPDGVVATAPRLANPTPSLPISGIGLVIDRLQDPGNLGTLVRTAVAADIEGLWLSEDSVDVDNPKVLRASAGTWFQLPIAISPDLPELVRQSRQAGVRIIATCSDAGETYWDIDFQRPSLLLLGNEGAGLSPELLNLADVQVRIPLANQVESLNVAIATALFVFEAQRQRQ
ncbi:rRNA methyltransferase [Leptolyngbya valderiana BDU 20041]|nr:RNA methyltransferase [Geitlerinema sp. CS-897]OAB60819.1 rRNA methyltransferase [Leptolyngbya valderiana BDU 20041]PPT11050.1 RNA methyltransferase TrmH family [Geitlerinema sp. FC II]